MSKKTACLITCALFIAVFSILGAAENEMELQNGASEPVIIQAIECSQNGETTECVIRANIPFEYTSYDPDPGTLIIEIPEGNIDALPALMEKKTDHVKEVRAKKITGKEGDFSIGRIEFSYSADARHSLFTHGNTLSVTVEGSKATEEIQEEVPVLAAAHNETYDRWEEPDVPYASSIRTLAIDDQEDSYTEITIEGDGKLVYESFTIEDPDRIVFDIQNVSMLLPGKSFDVNGPYVERVRASQYRYAPEKVARVVFDLKEVVPYDVSQSNNQIKVRFGRTDEPSPVPQVAVAQAVVQDIPEKNSVEETAPIVPEENAYQSDTYANEATLVEIPEQPAPPTIEPTPPVAHSMAEAPPDTTSDQYSKEYLEKVIDEKSREDYVIFREEPKKLAAMKEEEKKPAFQFETVKVTPEEVKYTGKKISLNLVDADIKQVFRLFHEISGLNFVLDPGVSGKVTIVLDNVPWDQALDIILKNNGLDKVFENNVIRIAATQKLAQEAASRKQLKDVKELEADPVTITRTLSYAKAVEVEKIIRQSGMISPRGRVIMDERTNSLVVTDVPTRIGPIDNLISSIDTETPQVMIEARIVETSRQFIQDFGVKWGFTGIADSSRGTATNLQFPHNATVNYDVNLPFTPVNAISPSLFSVEFGNVLNSFNLDIAIEALEVDGKGRVLSAPKIATQNNEKAEIERGVRIPVVNTTATEINVEFVSASLRLQVTPQITAEGTIVLDIQVENNTPDFVNRVGDVPPINTQRAQTKVLINDGGTTVIGGIFTQSEGLSEAGVPWFRKIPVFGWLFKRRNITNENRELLIFLTAKIMRSSS